MPPSGHLGYIGVDAPTSGPRATGRDTQLRQKPITREEKAPQRGAKKSKRRWGYYDFGPFTLGVGPVNSEHGDYALVMTVGKDSFPLAYYDKALAAKGALHSLDSGVHALHHDDHESPAEDRARRRSRKEPRDADEE